MDHVEEQPLSREALAASLPDVGDVTADLVGWAADSAQGRRALPPVRARRVLTRAVDRLRALVDQSTRLAGQVTVDELTGALRRGAGLVAALRDRLRSYDLIVRYGGDEFLCVLTGGGISVGIGELTAGDSVDALVERADAALYAGRRGRAMAATSAG
ncbi:MAG: hypothetical protein ABI473_11835 [Candidatus Dormibacter sp.]